MCSLFCLWNRVSESMRGREKVPMSEPKPWLLTGKSEIFNCLCKQITYFLCGEFFFPAEKGFERAKFTQFATVDVKSKCISHSNLWSPAGRVRLVPEPFDMIWNEMKWYDVWCTYNISQPKTNRYSGDREEVKEGWAKVFRRTCEIDNLTLKHAKCEHVITRSTISVHSLLKLLRISSCATACEMLILAIQFYHLAMSCCFSLLSLSLSISNSLRHFVLIH